MSSNFALHQLVPKRTGKGHSTVQGATAGNKNTDEVFRLESSEEDSKRYDLSTSSSAQSHLVNIDSSLPTNGKKKKSYKHN